MCWRIEILPNSHFHPFHSYPLNSWFSPTFWLSLEYLFFQILYWCSTLTLIFILFRVWSISTPALFGFMASSLHTIVLWMLGGFWKLRIMASSAFTIPKDFLSFLARIKVSSNRWLISGAKHFLRILSQDISSFCVQNFFGQHPNSCVRKHYENMELSLGMYTVLR